MGQFEDDWDEEEMMHPSSTGSEELADCAGKTEDCSIAICFRHPNISFCIECSRADFSDISSVSVEDSRDGITASPKALCALLLVI